MSLKEKLILIAIVVGGIGFFVPLLMWSNAVDDASKAKKQHYAELEHVKEVERARADQAERDQRKLWWHMNDLACEARAIKDENAKLRETLGLPSVMVKPKEESQ
jgi:hypothetical protein